MYITDNIRIKHIRPLISPSLLAHELPISDKVAKLVQETRSTIKNIIQGIDNKIVVVVGPCSIHDPQAALDYAKQLKVLADHFKNELLIIMRVYFEKPRTTVGWKGLINDPHLDESYDINHGLRIARKLLLEINSLGIATGSEFLDTFVPQYLSDLTSWAAIGARTTESQIHRELASGLSMPVGFKNGTTGNTQIAADAVFAAKHPHHFLGLTKEGLAAIVSTTGNPFCHIILRGSNTGPNYDEESINLAISQLAKYKLKSHLMVDCSHGNSEKDHMKQAKAVQELCRQINNGSDAICGMMLESNLVAGKQNLDSNESLIYGQSITDACIDITETQLLIQQISEAIKKRSPMGV